MTGTAPKKTSAGVYAGKVPGASEFDVSAQTRVSVPQSFVDRWGPRGRADRRANPVHTGAAVARAARERNEQERETPPCTARRLHLPAHVPRTGSRVMFVDLGAPAVSALDWCIGELVRQAGSRAFQRSG